MEYVLKGGRVVDSAEGIDGLLDIAVSDGRIAEVGKDLVPSKSARIVDVSGKVVMPGLIDTHVHCTGPDRELGFGMLVRAGVTTALDCGGPVSEVLRTLPTYGAGINVAVLNQVVPGDTVASEDPSGPELEQHFHSSLSEGAFGVKLIGGHRPLTLEATERAIRIGNELQAYVAFHAGSTSHGSNLEGFIDALQVTGTDALHLCHINAYCRGLTLGDEILETQEALRLLQQHPSVVSESHLAPYNGTGGRCRNGEPVSHVTRTCLAMGGFPPTQEGLAAAIKDGYALVMTRMGDQIGYITDREEAHEYWRSADTRAGVSFPVNRRSTAFLCATARRPHGHFIIEGLSTDGGGIPRNFLLSYGLLLVKFGAMSLLDFVSKVAELPARMLGLDTKGKLAPGADADITVVDYERQRPDMTIIGGRFCMVDGVLNAQGGTLLTTERGRGHASQAGVQVRVVDTTQTLMYQRKNARLRGGSAGEASVGDAMV